MVWYDCTRQLMWRIQGNKTFWGVKKISPWSVFIYGLIGIYKVICPAVRIPSKNHMTIEKHLLSCSHLHARLCTYLSFFPQPNNHYKSNLILPVSILIEASNPSRYMRTSTNTASFVQSPRAVNTCTWDLKDRKCWVSLVGCYSFALWNKKDRRKRKT